MKFDDLKVGMKVSWVGSIKWSPYCVCEKVGVVDRKENMNTFVIHFKELETERKYAVKFYRELCDPWSDPYFLQPVYQWEDL